MVADANAALGQDHKTADVIGRQLLQAQPDTHADGTTKNRQGGQVDADGRQGQHQTHEDQQGAGGITRGFTQGQLAAGGRAQQARLNAGGQPQGQHHHRDGSQHALDDRAQRQRGTTHLPTDGVELVHQRRQKPADPQRKSQPHGPRNRMLQRPRPAGTRESNLQNFDGQANQGQRHENRQNQLEQGQRNRLRQTQPRQLREAQDQHRKQSAINIVRAKQHRSARVEIAAGKALPHRPHQPAAEHPTGKQRSHFPGHRDLQKNVEPTAQVIQGQRRGRIKPVFHSAPILLHTLAPCC